MALSVLQFGKSADNPGAALTAAASLVGVTAGSTLVAICVTHGAVTNVQDTSNGNVNWTSIDGDNADITGSTKHVQMFYFKNSVSGNTTVTVTTGTSGTQFIGVWEVGGADTSAPLDTFSHHTSGASLVDATVTFTPANGSLVLMGVGWNGPLTTTPGAASGDSFDGNVFTATTTPQLTGIHQTALANGSSVTIATTGAVGVTGSENSETAVSIKGPAVLPPVFKPQPYQLLESSRAVRGSAAVQGLAANQLQIQQILSRGWRPNAIKVAQNISQTLTATLSFTGPANLTNAIQKGLGGGLSFTGPTNLQNAITKGLVAAGLSFTGPTNLAKTIGKTVSGVLSFTGPVNLKNAISKGVSAGLSFSGALKRAITTKLAAATLSFAGALTKFTTKGAFTATLSFAGSMASNKIFLKTLTATLSFAGSIAKQTNKGVGGVLSFAGSLPNRAISKGLGATLSFVGAQSKAITTGLAGKLSFNYYYSRVILVDSPAAYWRLDDAATMADASGNGHTGTPGGFGPTRTNGAISDGDAAMFFANTFGVLVSVPTDPALHPGDTFSLEFWLLYSAGSKGRGIINAGTGDYTVDISTTGSGVSFGISSAFIGTLALSYADGLWHHMVWVKSGATSHFYVDGADVTPSIADQTVVASTAPITIGVTGQNGAPNVSLDEVAIYGTALSAARILAHYNAAFQISPLTKLTLKGLAAAALSFGGALTKQSQRRLTATLSFTGNIPQRVIGKALSGGLSFLGSIPNRAISKSLAAALSFAGSLAHGASNIPPILITALTRSFLYTAATRTFAAVIRTRDYLRNSRTR